MRTRSVATTLQQIVALLQDEVATLRAALDVQFTRMAQMQAELDILPLARKRRQTLRARLGGPPSHNGNGNGRIPIAPGSCVTPSQ